MSDLLFYFRPHFGHFTVTFRSYTVSMPGKKAWQISGKFTEALPSAGRL
uniref:Uncharacterized protein n=1 Tax=Anguilla anguilla TaxID=7936 RepID=A0A0E9PUV3_ANGAN